MSRSLAHYPFPDDDNQTLHSLIGALPESDRRAITWRPTGNWLLEASPGFARALADMFADAGVRLLDPDWRPGGVFVPDPIRASVEGVLRCVPDSSAVWFQVEGIEFDSAEARQAFEAAL